MSIWCLKLDVGGWMKYLLISKKQQQNKIFKLNASRLLSRITSRRTIASFSSLSFPQASAAFHTTSTQRPVIEFILYAPAPVRTCFSPWYLNSHSINQSAFSSMSSAASISQAKLLESLGQIASLQLAEKWDNVGLLIESLSGATTPINSILLTIDLTEQVVEEAIQKRVQFILAYHPPIFDALKQVTTKTTKQRIVIKCLSNGISVYSPHTAFDSVRNGINDWLAEGLGEGTREPIKPIIVDGAKVTT